jgi:hypothetical protein
MRNARCAVLVVFVGSACSLSSQAPPGLTVGSACTNEYVTCDTANRAQALHCGADRKYEPLVLCPGGLDCRVSDDAVDCAGSGVFSHEGDPCSGEKVACAPDDKGYLECSLSKWVAACEPTFSPTKPCSQSYTARDFGCLPAGAALCDAEGAYTCELPTNIAYRCDGKHFVKAFECPKPQSCFVETVGRASRSTLFSCGSGSFRVHYAREGDPCAAEGSAACTTDQSAVLQCDRGKWVLTTACSGPLRCGEKNQRVECQ